MIGKILVVGGAGYVGGTASAWLLDQGYEVWVLDDLSTGHRELVQTPNFIHARAGDRAIVAPFLQREQFDCVLHFAAFSLVGESVQNPEKYRENNIGQTAALLEMMLEAETRNFIFSSTCAIFGAPQSEFVHENLPKSPINPYGETKLEVERRLEKLAAQGLRSVSLRYFNAAGADAKLRVGERHLNETHLIPCVLKALRKGEPVRIFGTDYPTPDGTCIRDYIHVWDLAEAHGSALGRLLTGKARGFEAYNLGSENGHSVREVIAAAAEATGITPRIKEEPRRAGDPPRLVGDSKRAREILGFHPRHSLIDSISSAWAWECR